MWMCVGVCIKFLRFIFFQNILTSKKIWKSHGMSPWRFYEPTGNLGQTNGQTHWLTKTITLDSSRKIQDWAGLHAFFISTAFLGWSSFLTFRHREKAASKFACKSLMLLLGRIHNVISTSQTRIQASFAIKTKEVSHIWETSSAVKYHQKEMLDSGTDMVYMVQPTFQNIWFKVIKNERPRSKV